MLITYCNGSHLVLALAKNGERWIWIYTTATRRDVCWSIGRFAADPESNLSWYDAAALLRQIRSS